MIKIDKKENILVTIITSVFNGADTLEKSILSVVNQSYNNIELIIIDGGSIDGTLEILTRYDDVIDYWVSEPDTGVYNAWNKAIKVASGDWIAFLGADDIYLDGAIDAYVNFINHNIDSTIEYISSKIYLTKEGKVLRTVGKAWNWKDFKKLTGVAHVGSFHKNTLFEKYGMYDENYKICGDYELLLRPGRKLKSSFMDIITVDMAVGGISNNSLAVFDEAARIKIHYGLKTKLGVKLESLYLKIKYTIKLFLYNE